MKDPLLLAFLAFIALLLGGCTYDEVASFGRAVDGAAASYYRSGYIPQPTPVPVAVPVY